MALLKMNRNKMFLFLVGALLVSGMIFSTSNALSAVPSGNSQMFASPENAVEVFIKALTTGDQQVLTALFGPKSVSQLSSGDTVRDRADREAFLNAYRTRNFLEKKGPGRVILHVGNEDWPFPIPLVKQGKGWVFASEEGREELLNRRIGRNELRVIETMAAYVAAQREYAGKDLTGSGIHAYAQKILSTPGKKDGLYWPAEEGEAESPMGPLAAMAAREGYSGRASGTAPFQGYYFRILTAQGKSASGGAYDYVVKGSMILGFGLIAYPAKYGSSGIMTFIVNQQGVIYQQDFGKNTMEVAEAIQAYNPDLTWQKVE